MLTNVLLDTHHGVTRYDRATKSPGAAQKLMTGQSLDTGKEILLSAKVAKAR